MSEKQRQRKLKRGKRREDRRKYGHNKKRRAENKAEAATKRKALAQAAIVGGDAKAGYSKKDSGNYTFDGGETMTVNKAGNSDDGASAAGVGKAAVKAASAASKTGASMLNKGYGYRGRNYDNVPNMSVPAQKLQKIQHGSSMYNKKHHGSSMNASQDKSASMDDYSHEKKLKADGRYEAAHGKMANAKNDFDHAHALKKDAHHDARSRVAILKHMRKF